MGENVAVPQVLPSKIDFVVCDRDPGSIRSEPSRRGRRGQRGARRQRRIDQADAVGYREGNLSGGGNDRSHRNDRMFQRIDPERVFPAQFVGFRHQHDPVHGNAVDELRIEQVDVDGVRIHAVVGDLPYLGAIGKSPYLTSEH